MKRRRNKHQKAMRNIGNPEKYNLDWKKIEVARNSKKSALQIMGEINPADREMLGALRMALADVIKEGLVGYGLSMSKLNRIKLWLMESPDMLPEILRAYTPSMDPKNPIGVVSPDKKTYHIIVRKEWFDTVKAVLEGDDLESGCTYEQFAALFEIAGDGAVAFAQCNNAEDFIAEPIDIRRHGAGKYGPATQDTYERQLQMMAEKGVVLGLNIGPNPQGKRLAMKYLGMGIGDHVPDAEDQQTYPELSGVTVRLSWEPSDAAMKNDWMIDVIFKASSGREEQFGFRCYCTDHELTLNKDDTAKLRQEIQNDEG